VDADTEAQIQIQIRRYGSGAKVEVEVEPASRNAARVMAANSSMMTVTVPVFLGCCEMSLIWLQALINGVTFYAGDLYTF